MPQKVAIADEYIINQQTSFQNKNRWAHIKTLTFLKQKYYGLVVILWELFTGRFLFTYITSRLYFQLEWVEHTKRYIYVLAILG